MSGGYLPPPFFPAINGGGGGGASLPSANNLFQPQQPADPPPAASSSPPSSSSSSASSSIIIVVIVIASAVIVSATIYLILRLLSRRCHRSFRTHDAADDVISSSATAAAATAGAANERRSAPETLESLPLFTFGSVTGNLTGVDCAVCLSKFETHDQLRLLPLCCHAFHAQCIDSWLSTNQTCPLCRSTVYPTDADILRKILSVSNGRGGGNADPNSGSFRIEIGSVSRRRGDSGPIVGDSRRSYSVGSSFEYIVDDGYEVSIESIHRRGGSECTDKESIGAPVPEPPGDSLAPDVSGGGRSWLRDYVDRIASFSLSSRTMSFRGSGRFFTDSGRRSDTVVPIDDDLESGRIGEEISELFRWLSGV
ncbi:E3 ubiquitin-protein ligase ATL4 [Ipomoea triloba]|uniref:E3 ubiquitin-protein ligase ATL4 n=1 Tax=Ipomoea triloba TaxID=35885 RepID=UPI00125D1707|nr:E3 ubiquitin-protein ligase ATL4 [Ipomoea triloba]